MKTKNIKSVTILFLILVSALVFTSCGMPVKGDMDGAYNSALAVDSNDGYYDAGFRTGGDYSSIDITGDKADYSYSFSAGGDTNKSKEEMLKDYERVQTLVDSLGGYISSVNNDYSYYDEGDSYYGDKKRDRAQGRISFTAEVDNADIPKVVDLLEGICQENRFTVTGYNQRITNYKAYTVGEETEDWEQTITQEELDRRLMFADISVTVTYHIPRSIPARIWMTVKEIFTDFWDMAGAVVKFFLALAFGLIVLFIQVTVFYKLFKRMAYKYRKKHPEYYRNEQYVVLRGKEE